LLVDIPDALKSLPPYGFYAVEITDFGETSTGTIQISKGVAKPLSKRLP
jgi:hypothetical protein